MNPDEILKQAGDNSEKKLGEFLMDTNAAFDRLFRRPFPTNPQTWDDLCKPIIGD